MLGPPAYTAVWVLIPNITFPDHPLVNPLPAWGLKPLNREQFDLKPSLAAKGWGKTTQRRAESSLGTTL